MSKIKTGEVAKPKTGKSASADEGTAPSGLEQPVCNICGWTSFATGPGHRLSATGKPPRCERCQSLERHRSVRRLFEKFRAPLGLAQMSCLQISPDRAVEADWFASYAVSTYGGAHSLDIQDLPLASGQFDLVLCNHVLEHVPDDRAAIRELFRAVSDRGFLQIGVPDPMRRPKTDDWGYPRPQDHDHFRIYGRDIVAKFHSSIESGYFLQIVERDPATLMEDLYFVVTRSGEVCSRMREIYPDATVEVLSGGKATPLEDNPAPADPEPVAGPLPRFHAAETLRDPAALMRYVQDGGHRDVGGWIEPGALATTVVLSALQRSLGVAGHVAEIGIHHGRYALALSLLRKLGERTIAIDVFEQQELNVDQSGKGDYDTFMANVDAWLGPEHDVVVLKQDSLTTTPADILAAARGRIRLFSVDGSHTYQHTLNDLRLAESVIAEGGIVVVDDFFNPAWPGVPDALAAYLRNGPKPTLLAPIGYGDNKFFLAERSKAEVYRTFIRDIYRTFTRKYKEVSFGGEDLIFFSSIGPAPILAPPSLMPDQKLVLDDAGPGKAMLFSGWNKIEPRGVWSKGGASTLVLRAEPASGANVVLALELTGLLAPGDTSSTVVAHVNGARAGAVTFTPATLRQKLELSILRKDLAPDGRIEIALVTDHSVVPAAAGIGPDRRRLSYFLSSVSRAA